MSVSTVTVWERFNSKSESFDYSHISTGWNASELKPAPNCSGQKKAWSGALWRKKPALLINGRLTTQRGKE